MISSTNASLQIYRVAQMARAVADHRGATYAYPAMEERKHSGSSRPEAHPRAEIHDLPSARASRRPTPAEGDEELCGSTPEQSRSPELSDDRAAMVQSLKAAIADGSYKPDPEAIARKLLERGL